MTRQAIALVGGKGLGDNLIEMVLMHNAHLQGYITSVYSDIVHQLREWFPHHQVYPSVRPERFGVTLEKYGVIFWSGDISDYGVNGVGQQWIDYMNHQVPGMTQVQNMTTVCRRFLSCTDPVKDNGIEPPSGLIRQRHKQRVCIHPTSADICKNWVPVRFLRLAEKLNTKGFEPVFIMSSAECPEWEPVVGGNWPLKGFETIAECAAYIYESGYFIGNDSGGGHLASSLNIPTLSIHGRRKKAELWQPDWGKVRVVTPPVNFVGYHLRQHYWKYLLTTGRVMRNFDRLVQADS